MSDYLVIAKQSGRVIRQRYYLTIVDGGNRKTLFTSEMYRDRSYAVELGQRMAARLDGNFVNLLA